ncbi:MAG: hypothetical protein AAGU27_26635 [Dehalobacterium sp.]
MKGKNHSFKSLCRVFLCCIWFWLALLPFPAFAITIADPFHGTDEYRVTGAGTVGDPYVIEISGTNNRITAVGLDLMAQQAPEGIWRVEHKAEDKIDYTLSFSTTIGTVIKAPLMLDVNAWQEEEGFLHLEVGEKDSQYLPATLVLDVSGFAGFKEGAVVTVRGKSNLRTRIQNNCLEFALENGGDHFLIAEGYEEPVEESPASSSSSSGTTGQFWDQPNDGGEAVAQEYTRAGTAELPFHVDLSSTRSSVVSGEAFGELKNNGQSRSFLWKDEKGMVLWSYLAEGSRMSLVKAEEEFDLAIDTGAHGGVVTAAFAHQGKFPGKLRVSLYVGNYFSHAAIVSIKGEKVDTAAVVDRGYITFWVEEGGSYTIADTGKTVASAQVPDAKAVSEETRDNIYTTLKYKGTGYGTVDEPLTLLGKLDDIFHASWKSMNTIAGYTATFNPAESSYDGTKVMKVMAEYRSPVTGKLIASYYIDGAQWRMTPESMKGPYYMDYKLNPSPGTIETALDAHSLYTGKYADRKEAALETLTQCTQSEDTVLFFMSRARDFAGVVNYKLDVSPYFQPGDLVNINYLLGSCNGDLYHGEAPNNAELLLEEASYSKYDRQTVVDAEGNISFPLYTGGFFTFSKGGVTAEREDNWLSSHRNGLSESTEGEISGDGAPGKIIGEQVEMKEELIEEEVSRDTHTATGTLVHAGDQDHLKEVNFTAQSEEGKVQVTGHLFDPTVSLQVIDETEKPADAGLSLSEGSKAFARYHIALKKPGGFTYQMQEEDYLDVTLSLGAGYSIYDQNLLFVKALGSDGQLTNEVFSSHSELDEKGQMYTTFRTARLSSFMVLRAADEKELTAAIALEQEYTSEATTALAEQSLEKEDENKTMKTILTATLAVLAMTAIITDIRRRSLKSGVERV